MKNDNPISPHIQVYNWHISSLVSISHRITGVLNYTLLILVCFWVISLLLGEENYKYFKIFSNSFIGKFFIIGFILVLFFFRLVLSFLGGNEVAHAPLTSFYAMFFSSIFGLSDNVVQTGQFIIFLGLSYFVYSNLNLMNPSRAIRFFITLALFTIPSFFFLGVVLEPVIWSIVCNSIVLCLLSKKDFKEYRILILFVVTMSFFRISSVFALFPIFIHFLFHHKQFVGTLDKVKNLFNAFAPLIIFIPFFIFANIISTAATNDSSISLARIINALINGTIWNFYVDVISPFFFIIYSLLILIFFRHKFVQLNFYYLIFLTIAFFSLNENVWPFAKYKLELFIPLLISLVFFVSNNIKSNMSLSILIFASLLISFVNINSIVGFPKSCSKTPGKIESQRLSYQLDFGCNYLIRVPYNLSSAFDYLESKNALSRSYVPGVFYGTFAFILNGISIKDLISANKIWDKQQELNKDSLWWGFDANPYEINNDIMIDYVLLSYTANSIELKEKLVSYGWEEVYIDTNKYDLSTIILKRPAYKEK